MVLKIAEYHDKIHFDLSSFVFFSYKNKLL